MFLPQVTTPHSETLTSRYSLTPVGETILLMEDLRNHGTPLDIEVSSLPAAQLDEIRKRYTLVKHVPGPTLDGVYVYKPRQ